MEKNCVSCFKAFLCLVKRIIIDSLLKYLNYIKNKKKWRGKLRFNHTVQLGASSIFEGANTIGNYSFFEGKMGYGSYMCNNCHIEGNIGRYTSIATGVENSLGVHPMFSPYVSTSPMFFSLRKQTGITFAKKQMFKELKDPIFIGNDCWIGQRVFIVGGVTIADGAIILAGAVVTKDVPPYAIVGGVPAKVLKYRYDDETIKFLLKTKWWEYSPDWLKNNSELFCNMDEFKKYINKL